MLINGGRSSFEANDWVINNVPIGEDALVSACRAFDAGVEWHIDYSKHGPEAKEREAAIELLIESVDKVGGIYSHRGLMAGLALADAIVEMVKRLDELAAVEESNRA